MWTASPLIAISFGWSAFPSLFFLTLECRYHLKHCCEKGHLEVEKSHYGRYLKHAVL